MNTLSIKHKCIIFICLVNVAKVSAMICEYFAVAINAVHQVKREPYCVSINRLEVSKFVYYI